MKIISKIINRQMRHWLMTYLAIIHLQYILKLFKGTRADELGHDEIEHIMKHISFLSHLTFRNYDDIHISAI